MIKKGYYLIFFKLKNFMIEINILNWRRNESTNAWAFYSTLQELVVISIFFLAETWLQPAPHPDKYLLPLFIGSFGVIWGINYYLLLYKNKWKAYRRGFNSYSKQKNLFINFGVFALVLGILGLLSYSVYLFSLVDWRHLNH
jgi:hypothetical protein